MEGKLHDVPNGVCGFKAWITTDFQFAVDYEDAGVIKYPSWDAAIGAASRFVDRLDAAETRAARAKVPPLALAATYDEKPITITGVHGGTGKLTSSPPVDWGWDTRVFVPQAERLRKATESLRELCEGIDLDSVSINTQRTNSGGYPPERKAAFYTGVTADYNAAVHVATSPETAALTDRIEKAIAILKGG